MNYAVDYQEVGTTYVASLDAEGPPAITHRMTTWIEKLRFLEALGPNDTVYGELGGAGDAFFLRAHRAGAEVLRVTPILVKEKREELGWDKARDAVVVGLLAQEGKATFYPYHTLEGERGALVAELRALVSWHHFIQRRLRIPYELKMKRTFHQLALINPPLETVDEYIKHRLREEPLYRAIKQRETQLGNQIAKVAIQLPIYGAVFSPLDCSPGIAGYIIARIIHIERFSSEYKLTAYAGWELDEEGEVPEMRGGDKPLKDAFWRWVFGICYKKPYESKWRRKLDEFKARDRARHPEVVVVERPGKATRYLYTDAHIHERGKRRLVQHLIGQVYRDWTRWKQ